MSRILSLFLFIAFITACGGGGGGGSSDSAPVEQPPANEPEPEPTEIALTDSVPAANSPNVNPGQPEFNVSHLGQSDLAITFSGDCAGLTGNTIRRGLLDMATADFDQILDHQMTCNADENSAYTINADGRRDNDARFIATLPFDTGTTTASGITVLDSIPVARGLIDDIFNDYVEGALINELELPGFIESLVIDAVIELAEANWDNLTDPDPLYHVTAERVSYLSRTPDGAPSAMLSGLIVRPEVTVNFTPRDRFIILSHATGSTPGDLNPADAWFILANMFASRGYLVVAPDNYGRGATSEAAETYLMANRTAYNTLDMVDQVLANETYSRVYDGNNAAIIGYSQGGHTAMALWQMTQTRQTDINVEVVYSGGAPLNLYQTVRGVLKHIEGTCGDDPYCENVDTETTVPFATDRILPALFGYTETGLAIEDVVTGDTIAPAFVSGFLANDAEYDTIKSLLQLNSFTTISNPEIYSSSTATVHLYHSDYDRLVPIENTQELASLLSPHITLDHHTNRCNSSGYEVIYNLTSRVGVLHTLCGLAVLDDAMEDLR